MLTLDASTTSTTAFGITSHTFSHTCGDRPERGLFVVAALKGSSVSNNPINFSCTYGGVAMTKIGEVLSSSTFEITVVAFYLAAPATGAHNVVLSWTFDAAGQMVASSYFGVHQGSPVLAGSYTNTTFAASLTPSITVTSTPGDIVMDGIGYARSAYPSTATAGAGQTEVLDIDNNANGIHAAASVEDGASSVAMSWTITDVRGGAQLGFSIHAASLPAGIAISPAMIF